MDINEIAKQLVATEASALTPQAIALLKVLSAQKAKQDALEEKARIKQEKKDEKAKIEMEKERKRYKPVKRVIKYLNRIKKIEDCLDLTEQMELQSERDDWKTWFNNGVRPFSIHESPAEYKKFVKFNATSLIKRILHKKQTDRFGMITTNMKRGYRRFLLKTEYGVLTGTHAREYLGYILGESIKPVKELVKELYDDTEKKIRKGYFIETEEKSPSMDAMLQHVGFTSCYSPEAIEFMVDYMIDECGGDDEFMKDYHRANQHEDFRRLIVKLPIEAKLKMFNDIDVANLKLRDSSSECGDDSDSDDSDSDSD